MNKNSVIVEVICPCVSRTYDFVLCKEMTIQSVIDGILDEISEYESDNKLFSKRSKLDLVSERYDYPLESSRKLEDYGIKSGDRLMLI